MNTPNPFWVFFLGGEITDMVNTISVNLFQLKFPNFRRPVIFNRYLLRSSLQLVKWPKHLRLKMKNYQSFFLQSISQSQLFQSSLQKLQRGTIRNRLRLVETDFPRKKINISRINSFLWLWFFLECEFLTKIS